MLIRRLMVVWGLLAMAPLGWADVVWERRSLGLAELDARCVVVSPAREGGLYAGTGRAVYRSQDAGRSWQMLLKLDGDRTAVRAVVFPPQAPARLLVGTAQGLWSSSSGGEHWQRIWTHPDPAQADVHAVAFASKRTWLGREEALWLIGSGGGLWSSDDQGKTWRPVTALPATSVQAIVVEPATPGRWVVGTTSGIWVTEDHGGHWRRVQVLPQEGLEPDEPSTESNGAADADEVASREAVHDILAGEEAWYAATTRGLMVSQDRGERWQVVAEAGLGGVTLHRLVGDQGVLYAATSEGVLRRGPEAAAAWVKLAKGFAAREARALAITHSETTLWSATDQGIFAARPELNLAELAAREADQVFHEFAHEPTIHEVQAKAVAYAEVHPEKILQWRRAAANKAWMPTLSLGADYDKDRTIASSTSAGTTKFTVGPEDRTIGYDVGVSWNLGELVWNDDQTSIDVRSRLMVQLRDDILDETTRYYFERRRLQIELLLAPPQDLRARIDKELRIQELTASLDALTGGWFSRELASRQPTNQ